MKNYNSHITLNKNIRGCYILDTVKGCSICSKSKPKGCYDDCYAKNISYRYGFNFSNVTERKFIVEDRQLMFFNFVDSKHIREVIKKIKHIDMPFIRIGEMGDPSENWEHTINICKIISETKKHIVIITKHWKTISRILLEEIEKMDICINTSISALDTQSEINHRLLQYNIIKNYCNSVLRIVSCDFNKENKTGYEKSETQKILFDNSSVIDTIFRPSLNNPLVENKIINIKKVKFLKKEVYASVFNNKTYFGICKNCPEMCGIK